MFREPAASISGMSAFALRHQKADRPLTAPNRSFVQPAANDRFPAVSTKSAYSAKVSFVRIAVVRAVLGADRRCVFEASESDH